MSKFENVLILYGKSINDFKVYCKENKISANKIESKKQYIKLLLKKEK